MKLNPIIKKDLKIASRSMKLCWTVFAYEGILVWGYLMTMAVIQGLSHSLYSDGIMYSKLTSLFPVMAVIQFGIILLTTPILTSASITGERERQTFDLMLTTCVTPLGIIFGKVGSAMIRVLFYVFASLPIISLAFILGGLNWWCLVGFVAVVLVIALFAGSIGIFCSSFCRKTIVAVLLSFAIYGVFFGATFMPVYFHAIYDMIDFTGTSIKYSVSLLILLLNPSVMLEEFVMKCMTGSSALSEIADSGDISILIEWMTKGPIWCIMSCVVLVGISFLFMFWASRIINPARRNK